VGFFPYKDDYKAEYIQYKEAAHWSALRYSIKFAIVTIIKFVLIFKNKITSKVEITKAKEKYGGLWFEDYTSTSVVL
jgi:hypothetical protein